MAQSSFDPYYKWLGIAPTEQPPNHYRLLGINLFESDPDVIQAAADQRMIHLRSFQTGQHGTLSQKLLNEVSAAKICLLKVDRRAAYDAGLRGQLAARQAAAMPPSVAAAPPPLPTAPAQHSTMAADYADVHAATATAHAAPTHAAPTHAAPAPAEWQPDPLDFTNARPTYKTAAAVQTKSKVPVAMLIAAPILGLAVVMIAIKVFNDREEAANLPSKPSQTTTPVTTPTATNPFADSRPSVVPNDPRTNKPDENKAKLVLDWPIGERFNGFVIIDGVQRDISRETRPLEYPLGPGEHKVSLRRLGWAPIDITVPSQSPGQRFAYRPTWKPIQNNPNPEDVARNDRPIHVIPDQPEKNPGDKNPPDNKPDTPDPVKPPIEGDNNPKPPASDRAPVPDQATQQKALAHVKDVLKDTYAAAKGSEGQLALARKLAELANGTADDAAARYVMATQALEIAIRQCDPALASQLVGGLSTHYEVDAWELKSNTLSQLAHTAKSGDVRAGLAKAALDLVDKAVAEDRYDVAVELAGTASFVSTQLKEVALRDAAKDANDRVKRMQKGAQDAKAAAEVLKTMPDDPDANLTVGKFRCFLKDDWKFGTSLLAKGNDEAIKKLADAEASPPTQSAEQAKLADQWWELAEKRAADKSDAAKKDEWTIKPMRARAVYWYRQALPELSGLALAKAQKRIDEAGPGVEPVALETTFLDDMAEQGVSVGVGRLGKHGQNWYGFGQSKVRGAQPQHALAMHPPANGSATASYNLNGKYRSFTGIAAIMDDAKQLESAVTFRVYGDGKQLWTSRPLHGPGQFQEFSVRVASVQSLKLEITCTGKNEGAHSIWVTPMVTK